MSLLKFKKSGIQRCWDLRKAVAAHRTKFVIPHLGNPTAHADVYATDIRAFCLLCHADIEHAIEDICLATMDYAIDLYLATKIASDTLVAMAARLSETKVPGDGTDFVINSFSDFRLYATDWKRHYSSIVHDNHGVRIANLHKILRPLAIDIDNSAHGNSLDSFGRERGNYAHKGYVTRVLSPEDADQSARDAVAFARSIASCAAGKFERALAGNSSHIV